MISLYIKQSIFPIIFCNSLIPCQENNLTFSPLCFKDFIVYLGFKQLFIIIIIIYYSKIFYAKILAYNYIFNFQEILFYKKLILDNVVVIKNVLVSSHQKEAF